MTSHRDLLAQARSAVARNGLSALKSGAAAVVAWLLAQGLMPSGADFYAPLVAVLSVQPTVVKTLRDTTQRLSGVVVGLALGFVVVAVVGLHWWSLGGVLTLAAFVGGWRRLGEQGVQVPIAALLVILLAQQPTEYAVELLGEGVIGALTAAAVNLLVVPPLYVRAADSRLVDLRDRLGAVVEAMACDLGGDWPPDSPSWLEQARGVSISLEAAREAVEQGSESTVLNPRGRTLRDRPRVQRQALSTLEHVTVSVRDLAGTLEQAADPHDETLRVTEAFRPDAAAALHAVADALLSYGQPDTDAEALAKRRAVNEATAQVRRLQSRLTEYQQPDAASLLAEGALITELDLVVRELNRTPLYA